jgi:hypothetical protein
MNKPAITNISASVHARLINLAKSTNRPFNELLQRFAIERFLYRLSSSPHRNRFVLKGAMMMTAWRVAVIRPTKDIDLLGRMDNDIETLVEAMRDICQCRVAADGIEFDPVNLHGERIAEESEYAGVRVHVNGQLGRARLLVQIDIGFGDVVTPGPQSIDYPALLEFPAPTLDGYSRESAIAEKFHVLVSKGPLNSRMKDFYDIWLLSRSFEFTGRVLAAAIAATFHRRETAVSAEPMALTAAFADDAIKQRQWAAFLRKSHLDSAPSLLRDTVRDLDPFLRPVATALAAGSVFEKTWPVGGPWR